MWLQGDCRGRGTVVCEYVEATVEKKVEHGLHIFLRWSCPLSRTKVSVWDEKKETVGRKAVAVLMLLLLQLGAAKFG